MYKYIEYINGKRNSFLYLQQVLMLKANFIRKFIKIILFYFFIHFKHCFKLNLSSCRTQELTVHTKLR